MPAKHEHGDLSRDASRDASQGENSRSGLPRRLLDRATFARTTAALEREWLVTNGLGGFASGTVALANTRRYHGLLLAALRPPVERVLMLAKLDVVARYGGRSFALACNEYAGGVIDPQGCRYLTRFELEGQTPVWTYGFGDARLEQRIWMAAGRNTVYIGFTQVHGSGALDLELVPLCAGRDYHAHQHGGAHFGVEARPEGCRIVASAGLRPYRLSMEGSEFRQDGDWYWNFAHRLEAERGLDSSEDLYRPGRFYRRLAAGQPVAFVATAEADGEVDTPAVAHRREARRQRALCGSVARATPDWVRTLTLAADQYLVARGSGASVIAGYPWFADWGRDTMIALPGLALATGRHAEAAAILRTFAAHASEGMLPNRFPDAGETPEYNTVDATLWFFHAIDAWLRATRDDRLLEDLFPVLADILVWHVRGTRFGIGVDERDGLLRAGVPGVQLTWMDAKVGDRVVTPRIGKPVEVNALWHFALGSMAEWSARLGRAAEGEEFAGRARQVAANFQTAFWNGETGCLHDVIDVPEAVPGPQGRRVDPAIRPNQIFAVSLGRGLLDPPRARAVVATCARQLLTPVGLRSLSPRDPAYQPYYAGGPLERDGAYHQGTVWGWLLGPFVLAHHAVFGDRGQALALLEDASRHLDEACVGQMSEIFDAEPPHAPRGCPAQAWSVAETLRAWHVLSNT